MYAVFVNQRRNCETRFDIYNLYDIVKMMLINIREIDIVGS